MVSRPTLIPRTDLNPERGFDLPLWTHPAVKYYFNEWRLIRDAIEGEQEVKAAGEAYLPQLDGMDRSAYSNYLDRATYYNFTGRTLAALVGTLFRRKFKIEGWPADLAPRLDRITKDGKSFSTYMETAAEEYLALGRYGTLVDLPAVPSAQPKPYLVPYKAEDILDWDHEVTDPVTGQTQLTRVVLREWVQGRSPQTGAKAYFARYRVLALTDGVYTQTLHEEAAGDATLDKTPGITTIPLLRAEPLDFIPFDLLEAERPPLLDIARLNISHFRSYAHLEHGRFFTGLPVYYTETPQSGGEYYIGPSVVWELPPGGKAGILEYNGGGLATLERALREKEAQASSLGGRMIGVTAQSTAETDNQTALKDRNEQALLHRTARRLDESGSKILGWVALLSHAAATGIRVVFNKSFLYDAIGSREFRAIQSMYKDGILPIEIVHDYLVKAGVIDEEVSVDELKKLLESESSFPNNPDFAARKKGYPNAQAQISDENKDRELDLAERELDQEAEEAEKDRKAAKDKPPPVVPGAPGTPGAPPARPAVPPKR